MIREIDRRTPLSPSFSHTVSAVCLCVCLWSGSPIGCECVAGWFKRVRGPKLSPALLQYCPLYVSSNPLLFPLTSILPSLARLVSPFLFSSSNVSPLRFGSGPCLSSLLSNLAPLVSFGCFLSILSFPVSPNLSFLQSI